MKNEILDYQESLKSHPVYKKLNNIEDLKVFMKYHIFAVWDFMSLLKSLQRKITCVELPWRDSDYDPLLVQLINEIVLGEESDVDQNGNPCSHFSLYLRAMEEVGADTSLIKNFLANFDFTKLPMELREVISYHLDLAINGETHQVAASFFYGREKLIPDMFTSIVNIVEAANLDCPTLIYYFKRHIEVDGDEHGPKALKCLQKLSYNDQIKKEVHETALKSLKMRWKLWDFILERNQISVGSRSGLA